MHTDLKQTTIDGLQRSDKVPKYNEYYYFHVLQQGDCGSHHAVCVSLWVHTYVSFAHIHRQLLPSTDVELYPFPFQSTDDFISQCQTAISSFNLWLSQTSFPSWSQWTICGRLPDEDTACSLSAFSITDGRSLNCSFNSWATKAQTFILVWYRPVRLIFEQFDLWLAHTGVEFS